MQPSNYLTQLSLPDASASTDDDDENDEDDCDGYGEYVYDVADKLRVINAQLYADTTPVESQRPRRVQFREDPVEKIVCFSPVLDSADYSEDDRVLETYPDDEADGRTPLHIQELVGTSGFVTTARGTPDSASLDYTIATDNGSGIVECVINERLHEENYDTVKHAGASHFSNGEYPHGEEQGCCSDYSTSSDSESVEEDIPCHDSVAPPGTSNNSNGHDGDEEEISVSHETLCSFESDTTSSKESLQHKGQVQYSTSRPPTRQVSSADSAVRPKSTAKRKELRPRTSTGIRPTENAQSSKKTRLPKYGGNRRSVYGLPSEMKEAMQRKRVEEQMRSKQKEMELQKEQEERKREAQLAFQAWLARKKFEKKRPRGEAEKALETKHEVEQDVAREDSQSAFKMWLERKRIQKRQEEMTRKLKDLELANATAKATREDAERAYSRWLKKKEQEEREKKSSRPFQPALQRYSGLSPQSLRALELYLQSEEFMRYPEIIL
ncbi:uncharacterized protein LOC135400969 [Ornithodoros turicata]|uniref:uncharacterized protein LOC135400969 n=1 Tax=Ornithodoros turicata TaxID=34597 RepID=UPI003138BFBC